jgi:two-component system, chemotaxis family, protein-glutamate methylesterase/glutaminase
MGRFAPMTGKHLVVIGASAGGIETLRELVAMLPADFAAPIAIVLHTSPQAPGILHDILTRSGPLIAVNPANGERLQAGRIYVAPPDFHLLIEPGRVRITKGPRENRFRPAIDPLFRSAAQVYGPRAIGVVLTGNLDDGTAGLYAIKQLGGVAVVQDPADAMFPSMPDSALRYVNVDHVVALRDMAPLLTRLAAADREIETPSAPPHLDVEVRIAKEEDPISAGVQDMAEPSTFACPECHGVLLQLKEAGRIRFRCHTGHAYSAESLLAEISEGIEDALWNAIRSLQEGALLVQELSGHVHIGEEHAERVRLKARGDEMLRQANTLRAMVTSTMDDARDGVTAVRSSPPPS